jgi:DNA-binding SARP family transcriptional activator/tetratricopeptide (TPR) repeat protein
VEIRVLGPVRASAGGAELKIPGAGPRTLLAVLALQAGEPVSVDAIVSALWDDDVPQSAAGMIQTYVWRLRQALPPDERADLAHTGRSYVLAIDRDQVDALRFEAMVGEARRLSDPQRAVDLLDEALALWRGDVLGDLGPTHGLGPAAVRLELMRLSAVEARYDALLAAGRHEPIVGDLAALTRRHPLRERFSAQLMLAQYRCGHQAEALATYQRLRSTLIEHAGVEPTPELQALERAVLDQSEHLAWHDRATGGGEPLPLPRAIAAAVGGRPFVGRQLERRVLAGLVEQARSGRFAAAVVSGPPGIGKTVLVSECARAAHDAGATVVFGRADELSPAPFQPWRAAIRHWARHTGDDLAALLGPDVTELGRIVPELAGPAPAPPSSPAADTAERFHLFEAIVRWVQVLSSGRPAVIVLDDLQWADASTLLAVRHLLREPPAVGALLLLTRRHADAPATEPADLVSEIEAAEGVRRIDLAGLPVDDVATLVTGEIRHALDGEGRSFTRGLATATGGNPYFVIETLRHLTDRGLLEPAAGQWPSADPEHGGVPRAVKELVGRRLARLPEVSSAVLRAAAVLGHDFDIPIVAHMTGSSPLGVLTDLEPVIGAGLMAPAEGDRVEFAHAIIRHAILDGLPAGTRARLHWDAGTAIMDLGAGRLDEIAHHLSAGIAAGDATIAMRANIRAGYHDLQQFAFEDARLRFATAIDIASSGHVDDRKLTYAAWAGLGHAIGPVDPAGQRNAYRMSAAVARQTGNWAGVGQLALGFSLYAVRTDEDIAEVTLLLDEALAILPPEPSALRCSLLAARALRATCNTQAPMALTLADRAESDARELDDPEADAAAAAARAWALLGSARSDEIGPAIDRALARSRGRNVEPFVYHVLWALRSIPAMERGDRAAYAAVRAELSAATDDRPATGARGSLSVWDASFELAAGNFDGAERLVDALVAAGPLPVWRVVRTAQQIYADVDRSDDLETRRRGATELMNVLPSEAPVMRVVLTLIHALDGNLAAASREAERLRLSLDMDELGWDAPGVLRYLAELAALVDSWDLAEAMLAELRARQGRMLVVHTGVGILGAADRALGQCLLVLGQHDEAIRRFEAARALEEGCGAAALAARTTYWHARALFSRGAPGDAQVARTLLTEVDAMADRLGLRGLAAELHHLTS